MSRWYWEFPTGKLVMFPDEYSRGRYAACSGTQGLHIPVLSIKPAEWCANFDFFVLFFCFALFLSVFCKVSVRFDFRLLTEVSNSQLNGQQELITSGFP